MADTNEREALKLSGNRVPKVEQLKSELNRVRYQKKYESTLRSTVYVLIVTAAFVVLCTFLLFPAFRIYGSSMYPTVAEGEIVVSFKGSKFEQGDVIVLSFNNKLLVKRAIAGPGQWVDIDAQGNVFVDGVLIDEPYLQEKAYGDCTIKLPYQVPDGKYFVMGDNRSTSQDSRNSAIGAVDTDQIVGRAIMRVWPLAKFGKITAEIQTGG